LLRTVDSNTAGKEQTSCIPIANGKETTDILSLPLPDDMAALHRAAIDRGELFMSIFGASIEGEDVILPDSPAFLILDSSLLRI
jgi:hypothetical protein